jgi:hypothetical protein
VVPDPILTDPSVMGHPVCIKILSSGFKSPFGAVSENPLILARLLSLWVLGKVFFCLSEKSVSEREVRNDNVGTNYSVQELTRLS